MTAQVRAARIHAWQTEPVFEHVPAAEPGPDEALVAIRAAAVAHVDATVLSGGFAFRPPLPYTPGADGAGVVVRSPTLEPGTPVRIRGAGVGLERDGTWRELGVFPRNALEPLPADVDPAVAATFFVPCATAYAALHAVGRLVPGETVAVVGAAGAVGAVVSQLALQAGAARVVGVEPSPERARLLAAGVEPAQRLPEGETFDLIVDMAGGKELASRLRSARPEGRLVLVGYAAGTSAELDLPAFLAADVRLLPVNLIGWERRLREPARELLARVHAGELTYPLHRFSFGDLPAALRALQSGGGGRIAVTMDTSARPVVEG
jgi:NADPH2:quinone reductase